MRASSILVALCLSTTVAGCSQQTISSPTSSGSLEMPRVRAKGSFSTIYSFKGAPDGGIPEAGLKLFAGLFYGTTTSGGTGPHNDGTVYTVQLDGKESVLHSFTFTPDGAVPEAGLTDLNGLLYGTTAIGGAKSVGTVYEIKTDGTERVVYSFKNQADGANPEGDLIPVNGLLYGTTLFGGAASDGIVFAVHPDGTERVVYSLPAPRTAIAHEVRSRS